MGQDSGAGGGQGWPAFQDAGLPRLTPKVRTPKDVHMGGWRPTGEATGGYGSC